MRPPPPPPDTEPLAPRAPLGRPSTPSPLLPSPLLDRVPLGAARPPPAPLYPLSLVPRERGVLLPPPTPPGLLPQEAAGRRGVGRGCPPLPAVGLALCPAPPLPSIRVCPSPTKAARMRGPLEGQGAGSKRPPSLSLGAPARTFPLPTSVLPMPLLRLSNPSPPPQ